MDPPPRLSALIETKLRAILKIIEEIEERRAEERWRGASRRERVGGSDPPRPLAEVLAKSIIKSLKTNQVLVS